MSDEAEYRALTLRMPPELFERVRANAAAHDRSAGAEVRMIVREHLEQQKSTTGRGRIVSPYPPRPGGPRLRPSGAPPRPPIRPPGPTNPKGS
jgi:hypothetical protein